MDNFVVLTVNKLAKFQKLIALIFVGFAIHLAIIPSTDFMTCDSKEFSQEMCKGQDQAALEFYLQNVNNLQNYLIIWCLIFSFLGLIWYFRRPMYGLKLKDEINLQLIESQFYGRNMIVQYYIYLFTYIVTTISAFVFFLNVNSDFNKYGLQFLNGESDKLFPSTINCSQSGSDNTKCTLEFNGYFKYIYMSIWVLLSLLSVFEFSCTSNLIACTFCFRFRLGLIQTRLPYLDNQTLNRLARNRQAFFFIESLHSNVLISTMLKNNLEILKNFDPDKTIDDSSSNKQLATIFII